MTKTANTRDKYAEQTNVYYAAAESILKEEKKIIATLKENAPDAAFQRLSLADLMLNLTSHYIVVSGISQSALKQKNENALNDARKALYRSIICLEDVVSNYIDAPYIDYEEKLSKIDTLTPAQRYLLVRKMGLAIDLLKDAYGDNTKWRWTFVEIEGRYATVAKNIINLRDVVSNSNFDSPHYEPTVRHLKLVKNLLSQVADRYREKYELSTGRIDDFKLAITFLAALRRLHFVTGDNAEVVTVKKKLDTWNIKLASDMEEKEKQEKQKKE